MNTDELNMRFGSGRVLCRWSSATNNYLSCIMGYAVDNPNLKFVNLNSCRPISHTRYNDKHYVWNANQASETD